ncbi:MAG: hypothetical protein U1E65_20645 [Myxococcota bacterium]
MSFKPLFAICVAALATACGGQGGAGQTDDGLTQTEDALSGVPTRCYVYIDPPCALHPEVPSRTWINDNYQGSPFSQARCFGRARDFHQWCGLPVQGRVLAGFNLITPNGELTIGAQNVGGPGAPVFTYGLGWEELPTR